MTKDSPQTHVPGPLEGRTIRVAAASRLHVAAERLLASLGATADFTQGLPIDVDARWAAAGIAQLSGPPAGAVAVPFRQQLTGNLSAAAAVLNALADRALVTDPLALLAERVAFTGMTRQGATSVGGTCQILRCSDAWLALNLARATDYEMLPAWLAGGDPTELAEEVKVRTANELRAQAAFLGLPVGILGEAGEPRTPYAALALGRKPGASRRVLDLTSLWAGPLAGRLLAAAGYEVVKIEGRGRPDGARHGPRGFFDLMNGAKRNVTVDFDDPVDIERLKALMRNSALVLEGSRPRVMDRLGIDPADFVERGVGWISITAYGRTGEQANRVGFGDDAAVAGRLVAGDPPNFVGDAMADPITGLYAAIAALACLRGHAAAIDVALSRAAAFTRLH